ncbi:MAG: hypothetical protein M3P30_04845 [Chloroflexota bacterium]|nr:hypothetical protein [Chloroflexota bacterium]
MNAAEIIREVHRHEADLVVHDQKLVVRGGAERLPDALRKELTVHKAELMIALGVPLNATVGAILADIRPHLPPPLRRLPDERLLTLVNWSIIAAFESSIRKVSQ